MKNVYCQDFKAYFFVFVLCNPSFPFSGLNLAPKIKKTSNNRLFREITIKKSESLPQKHVFRHKKQVDTSSKTRKI